LKTGSSIVKTFANNSDLNLGRFTNGTFYYTGLMDEARIQSGIVSSNWVWANWMTVASNTTFASYSEVTQQFPALSAFSSGNNLALEWPANGVGFAIYTTTNLTSAAVWTLVTNRPEFTNGVWEVSLTTDAISARFFRLQAP
jgi:hypothetical protein